jgi:dipeptidyl aminopeptidase/acylaminoacyl peptidase
VLQVLPVTAAEPATAAWSPTGEEVAFVAADDQGTPGTLFLVGVEPAPRSIEPLVDGSPGLAVFGLSWLPDGRSLLFSQGDPSTAHATNTDLWRIGLDGEGRRLVASAGSAAPVADIDLFAPSPDGRAVAYTVVVPGDSGTAFHSLWIRDLGSGRSYPIAVPADIDVSELWWTSAGLVFRTLDRESQEALQGGLFEIYRVTEDGEALPIVRAMVGEATAATPVSE